MSVINSMAQGKRAYLFADRAMTDHNGVLAGTMCKFIRGTHFPWAMAYSGHGPFSSFDPHQLAASIGRRPCDTPERLFDAVLAAIQEATAATPGLSLGVQLAFWWARKGRAALMLAASDDLHFPGLVAPYEAREAFYVVQGTRQPTEYIGREVDFTNPKSFAPLSDGVELMAAQRRMERFERVYETPAYRVGGGCEVAIVGRRGVQIKTLWQWPDELGELIDPVATPGHPIT
jgi:hypothetical protein